MGSILSLAGLSSIVSGRRVREVNREERKEREGERREERER